MSGVTDPTEEYFKDGLWAWVTDQWKKLIGDAAGHLQVDVVESGLPTGAATSANQTTMITALQLIDDLRGALNSIHTDELDVVIDGQTADVEVKQTAAADLTPGIKGWDGSAWRKLPMVWGYSDSLAIEIVDTNAAADADTLVTGAVPAGEIWVVQAIAARDFTTDVSRIRLLANASGKDVFLEDVDPVGANVTVRWSGAITLAEDDLIEAWFTGTVAGDDIYLALLGYKMKVAE